MRASCFSLRSIKPETQAVATFLAKAHGTLAGLGVADLVLEEVDPCVQVRCGTGLWARCPGGQRHGAWGLHTCGHARGRMPHAAPVRACQSRARRSRLQQVHTRSGKLTLEHAAGCVCLHVLARRHAAAPVGPHLYCHQPSRLRLRPLIATAMLGLTAIMQRQLDQDLAALHNARAPPPPPPAPPPPPLACRLSGGRGMATRWPPARSWAC